MPTPAKTRGHFGWVVAGALVIAGLWSLHQPVDAPITAGQAVAAPMANGSGRISYPIGQYPQLRLSNGVIHPIHSVLDVTHPMAFGDYVWDAKGVAAGRVWVRVDLAKQMLSVFRGGDEIGTAVIIYGTKDKPTPIGVFHVLDKTAWYNSKSYDAPMPHALWLTTDGVALHASLVRERSATHGCIGLPADFARLLYDATSRGDEVEILPADGASAAGAT